MQLCLFQMIQLFANLHDSVYNSIFGQYTVLGTSKTQFYIILTHVLSLANACEKREGDAKKKEGKGGAYDLFF